MERIGNFWRQNLPQMQRKVEDKLDVELGKIDVLPLAKIKNELIDYFIGRSPEQKNNPKFSSKLICNGLVLFSHCIFYGAAGKSAIYYGHRTPSVLFTSKRKMMQNELHELTHIAHRRLLNYDGLFFEKKVPSYISHGFADYVAIEIMKDSGLKPIMDVFDSKYNQFIRDLSRKRISNIADVKDYVLGFK